MGDLVNLRLARKARRRAAAAGDAAEQRARFGRTRAEREAAVLEAERARRLLDGAKREE